VNEPTEKPPEAASAAEGSSYRVLARKYRPATFDDLIGQDAMVRTLANAFATGRIAHAYMLTGVRGVGKTTTARLIARALNYTGPGSENGLTLNLPEFGEHCAAILESRHIDVIEMDAASRTGVDDVRELIEAVRYRPTLARYKVYIIDEVHMLSKQAFNALLKTLEEPPPHVKFIFATTEIRKVPITVLSRCQRFDLRRLDARPLMAHLARIASLEGVTVEEEALRLLTRAAEGSVRDGLSLMDQAIAHCGAHISAEHMEAMLGLVDRARIVDLFEAIMRGDAVSALKEIAAQYAQGADPQHLLVDLGDFVHWVTRLKIAPSLEADLDRTEAERTRGACLAGELSMAALTRAWQMLLKGLTELRDAPDALAATEMIVIRLCYGLSLPSADDLAKIAHGGEVAAEKPQSGERMRPASRTEVRSLSPAPDPQTQGSLAIDQPPLTSEQHGKTTGAFRHFRDVVDFIGEKRDVKLKEELERYVRPVRLSTGSIEIALEPQAPAGLAGELARKLEAWTGERWMVSISNDPGEPPLRQQARARRDSLFLEAREHPVVKAVLDKFPGSGITDVRDPEPVAPSADSSDLSESEP
jgi:DNA polymerase-3 subunit gamma/tau